MIIIDMNITITV